jgi:RNA polymerase sigma-70 factor (ECF subfamily)
MAAAEAVQLAASDEQLVTRLAAGDRAAFDALYERYYGRVHAFLARRLGNPADVEETTQEVFFNLFASLHTFRQEAPFAAWVFGLTRRTLANRFKKRRVESVPLGDDDLESVPCGRLGRGGAQDPHEAYECLERLARLEAVAGELSREQRELFELHHLHFLSIEEIARTKRRSEDSIKSHLYRARRLLLAG